jgi:C4-dicarboxylate transporter, DctM subunit
VIALLVIGLFLFALGGVPLFAVLGLAALAAFRIQGIPTAAVISEMTRLATFPVLVSIPLFTFAGYMFSESKTPQRLVRVTSAAFGWVPGGLAIVAMMAAAVLTAFTGASGMTIVALGGLLMPALLQEKYSDRFTLGLLTNTGSLGLLFPPSLPLILYSYAATSAAGGMGLHLTPAENPSVDRLFLAGILPGIFLILVLAVYCIGEGRKRTVTRTPFRLSALWPAIKESIWEVPLPILILGGIYSGRLTVIEAAAVTALYALIVEVFIYRDIPLRQLPRITMESLALVGAILIILASALGFTNFLIDSGVPMRLMDWVRSIIASKVVFLLVLNLFLLVVGSLMEVFSALIVVGPLLVPLAQVYNINLVHLGIIFVANLELGFLTPPVGLNLLIASFRFRRPLVEVYRATLPWLGLLIIALAVITYFPQLSLFLLRWMPQR